VAVLGETIQHILPKKYLLQYYITRMCVDGNPQMIKMHKNKLV